MLPANTVSGTVLGRTVVSAAAYSAVAGIPPLRVVFQLGSIDLKGTLSIIGKIKQKHGRQIRAYK